MLRNVNSSLLTLMQQSSLQLCICVQIKRVDSVTLGFTSWDDSLSLLGITFLPTASVSTTLLRQSVGTEIDNVQISGILDSDYILSEDVLRGLYDGAEIKLHIVNPNDVAQYDTIFSGSLGNATYTDGKFETDVYSNLNRTKQTPFRIISQKCPYKRFAGVECNFNGGNLTGYKKTVTVTAVTDEYVFTANVTSLAAWTNADFSNSIIKGATGDNTNIEATIKSCVLTASSGVFTLRSLFPYAIIIGDTFVVEIGCNRTVTRCEALGVLISANQVVNFGGFPYVPGNDRLTQILRVTQ